VPMAQMLHGLRHYRGEPHRCQLLGILDGVEYYDDSKGTNVAATVAAIEGIRRPCWLIAGGEGKGQDFGPLAEPVRHGARGVVLIGRDAQRLADAIAGTGVEILRAEGMEEAVRLAAARARAGEAVLLSPACSSFHMFSGGAARGRAFAAALARSADERGQPLEAGCCACACLRGRDGRPSPSRAASTRRASRSSTSRCCGWPRSSSPS